jgi:hypothetical protein
MLEHLLIFRVALPASFLPREVSNIFDFRRKKEPRPFGEERERGKPTNARSVKQYAEFSTIRR